jgi:hypothetical protein
MSRKRRPAYTGPSNVLVMNDLDGPRKVILRLADRLVGRTRGAAAAREVEVVQSKAKTVDEYLSELPSDRRTAVSKVRDVVRRNLPKGYRESMSWGLIAWEVPLEAYPDTYNGRPLYFAGLAAQKNYCALYLTGAYSNPKDAAYLSEAFRKAGKKMDMGKSCLRFQRAEDLPLDAIGRLIKGTPPQKLIEIHEAARRKSGKTRPATSRRAAAKPNSGITPKARRARA